MNEEQQQKRREAAAKAAATRRRNREERALAAVRAIEGVRAQVQAICDAHSGRHLFEGGYGLSCFVTVTADVGGRLMKLNNAAYGHGLQLGAEFQAAMAAAGFSDFDITLD